MLLVVVMSRTILSGVCLKSIFMVLLLQGLTLHFVVLSFDRYSRDDVIGEVMLELESIDLSGSDTCPVPIAREITPRSFKVLLCYIHR